ncbi:MAG: hypothetical protein JWO46_1981 [Nocardioidaceae bacterium]|nr:hypothetical protein [Nocardioidaceae bacterium]
MDSQFTLSMLAMVISVASVVLSGYFSVRTQRLSHELEEEREARRQEQSAIDAAQRVYEPLAQAAAELQSRIFNIVETGWAPLQKQYAGHGDYAVTSTAFLFAHYFGWIEARREAVLSSSGEGRRDEKVQELIDGVLRVLRRSASEDSVGFLFFSTEQRAIGELMFSWQITRESEVREPHVMGYAAFRGRYQDDEDFRAWFTPVDDGMDLISAGDTSRLVDIQRALVQLVLELDPKHRYTAGYSLQPIP